MKYEVIFYDHETKASSPRDTITAPKVYTAEQYVLDCIDNADIEWCTMLFNGDVELVVIDN